MDYEQAVAAARIAMQKAEHQTEWDVPMVEVPYDVLQVLTLGPGVDDDDKFTIGRDQGPTLWYVGANGCAYNLDWGGSEVPEEDREQVIALALLEHASRQIRKPQ